MFRSYMNTWNTLMMIMRVSMLLNGRDRSRFWHLSLSFIVWCGQICCRIFYFGRLYRLGLVVREILDYLLVVLGNKIRLIYWLLVNILRIVVVLVINCRLLRRWLLVHLGLSSLDLRWLIYNS